MEYDEYVVKSILANDQFGITAVTELDSLKVIYFVKEEYTAIEKLIQANDTEAIKMLSQNGSIGAEYLDLMLFKDQNAKPYLVTVYDSDALEQDPQVIKIYPMIA
ncbi:hypothetical protein [Mucilaginibacter myungsuensis]|uniref:Uncharacterized protein n=1 Tax=Mucilaginibacter myungsuensis TaxID=649104 RepID=A0A929KU52_9SPHI|nr:hypothetical protein [Mucilaginibacter myungsuensis]MBE9660475.1 hypothetical protein [Mucilaginibacter myungsuensis]MDN3600519.1 hypothetical protein [Mucilaginibacter myungsuensis]